MRYAIALVLLCSLDASAMELLCQGTRFNTTAGHVEIKTPLLIAEPSLEASFITREGEATGMLKDFGTYYGGHITSASGISFWLYLDRYTGDLNVSYKAVDGSTYADFAGVCERATRKF